ncbi:hypothetical protein Tco_0685881 [Tanacetum coccineum]
MTATSTRGPPHHPPPTPTPPPRPIASSKPSSRVPQKELGLLFHLQHSYAEEIEDIECKDTYDSNLDEPTFLVTPLSDSNEDEFFAPGDDLEFLLHRDPSTPKILACSPSRGVHQNFVQCSNVDFNGQRANFRPGKADIDEIDAFLDVDISTDIKDGYHDSEGDIIYLESLLNNDIIPYLPPEVFLDHDPNNLKDEPDLKSMVKVFDPGIHEKKISPTYMRLPFKDRHYLSLTYVIRILLPYFTYPVESPFLFSSGNEDTIFDPGISAFHFSSLKSVKSHRNRTFICFNVYLNILNESPMEICSSTCFIPNITMIWGESS